MTLLDTAENAASREARKTASKPLKTATWSLKPETGLYFALSDLAATIVGLLIVLSLGFAYEIRFLGALSLADLKLGVHATPMAAFFAVTTVLYVFGGLYNQDTWETDELLRVSAAVGAAIFTSVAFNGPLPFEESIPLAAVGWLVITAVVFTCRMAVRAIPIVRESMRMPIVLVGSGIESDELRRQLKESRAAHPDIRAETTLPALVRSLDASARDQATQLERQTGEPPARITYVIVPNAEEMPFVADAVDALSDCNRNYLVAVPFFGLARQNVALKKVIGGDIVFADVKAYQPSILGLMVKRLLDVLIALSAIIVLSPALLIVAGMIKSAGGPILFSQLRVGKDRRRFHCYKFRTMVVDAEARLQAHLDANPDAKREWAKYQKLSRDPRITPVGRFLRKTSLDELPQIINVLNGDMSIVGARPIIAPEVPGYPSDRAYFNSPEFDDYARMRPGITGLWQVSGRASTTHAERVRLDRWYARNWTIWLDIVIFFKTARAAILGTGSS